MGNAGPGRPGRSPGGGEPGARNRADKRTVVWVLFLLLMPATLETAFLTHYVWFFVMFLVAFIGVAVTAQPGS